ncbi:TPA: hypothetical protein ACG0BA_003662 [Serratia odorifera]
MKELTDEMLGLVSGGDKDAVVAAGSVVGGLVGGATRIPNGGLYGSAIGSYVAAKGYDTVVNSPTITIPPVHVDPFTQGTPSYISRPGMNSSIYGN